MDGHERLIQKLQGRASLSAAELEALRALPMTAKVLPANAAVVREAASSGSCCLVVEGLMFRHQKMPSGTRQILSLNVPGDILDLHGLYLEDVNYELGALARSVVAFIPHADILALISLYPGVAAALWRETLIDAAIAREWLCNVGRRSAHQRTAHLFCELYVRMQAIGLTQRGKCILPMRQQEFADILGLSLVHVNRILQQLRADGLIALSGTTLHVPKLNSLALAGDFDPGYLHLATPPA